jgi:hypothetical protein
MVGVCWTRMWYPQVSELPGTPSLVVWGVRVGAAGAGWGPGHTAHASLQYQAQVLK